MGRIGLFFGSSGGITESIAGQIAISLSNRGFAIDTFNIADVDTKKIEEYDTIIFGTSTWGMGDLQDDWDSFLPQLDKINFKEKQIALFGTGDQAAYPDTFVDGIGIIYEIVEGKDVSLIGKWPVDGYDFSDSKALINGSFVGLVLDDDNQPGQTAERIESWTAQLASELT